jgi:HSP20 family protein
MARSLLPFVFGGPPAEPWTNPLMQLQQEMNRLVGDVFRGGAAAMVPRLDVSESDQAVTIRVELPGIAPDEIEVDIADDVITVRGEKRLEREDDNETYRVRERVQGAFARSIQLPFPVNPEQVQASFENGVLSITLPKAAMQQNVHRVPVQPGAGQQAGGAQQVGTGAQGDGAQTSTIDRAAAGDKPGGGGEAAGGGTAAGSGQDQAAETAPASDQEQEKRR